MYNSHELAKYIINKCIKENKCITNLQLQMIMYFIQIEYLRRGKHAFYDSFEAWDIGPILPNLYYEYCMFDFMDITFLLDDTISIKDNIVDMIVEEKREFHYFDLFEQIKEINNAWERTYLKYRLRNKINKFDYDYIPLEYMKVRK